MKTLHKHIERKAKKLIEEIIKKGRDSENITAEEVHDLRTTTKQLDALLQLIIFVGGNKKQLNTAFKPFHKVFKAAGQLRKLLLLQQSFKSERYLHRQDKQAILNTFSRKEIKASKAFKKLLNKSSIHKMEVASDKIRTAIKNASFLNIEKYFSNRKKKVEKSISLISNTKCECEEIHHARMLLKEVLYNAKLFKVNPVPQFNISHKSFDALLKALGDWHDKYSDQKDFSRLLNDHTDKWQAPLLIKKLNIKLIKQETLFRSQITKQLINVVNK